MDGIVRRKQYEQFSPSLTSDVLSGSGIPSDYSAIASGEWVLFSPQVSASHAATESPHAQIALDEAQSFHDDFPIEEEPIEPLDLSLLELPSHNGRGSFIEDESSNRLEFFERINLWCMEQFETSDDKAEKRSPWQWLRTAASAGLHEAFDWDDRTINALFNKDFVLDEKPNVSPSTSDDGTLTGSEHLVFAQQHAPGWEEKMLGRVRSRRNQGLLFALVSKLVAWSQRNEPERRHSYHFAHFPGTLASLSSTWSETSSSVVAAA